MTDAKVLIKARKTHANLEVKDRYHTNFQRVRRLDATSNLFRMIRTIGAYIFK